MNKKRSPQSIAHDMIRLNKALGLKKKKTLTRVRIERYIANNPTTTELVAGILRNVTLSYEEIAKVLKTKVGTISKFYLHAVESVVLNRPKIGKPLEVRSLIKYAKTLNKAQIEEGEVAEVVEPEKKKRGRPAKEKTEVVVEKRRVGRPCKVDKYTNDDKNSVRLSVLQHMKHPDSPKTGIVPSLPHKFAMEEMILRNRSLRNLTFHGYETGYSPGKAAESNETVKFQKKYLRKNSFMDKRVLMRNEDINISLSKGCSDQYAHILMDYCSSYRSNKSTIEYVLKNNLVQKGGIIQITLSGRDREQHKKDKIGKLLKSVSDCYKTEHVSQLNYAKSEKDGAVIDGLYYYNSSPSKMGGTMYVVILRRIK